jgi:hypothetical protein
VRLVTVLGNACLMLGSRLVSYYVAECLMVERRKKNEDKTLTEAGDLQIPETAIGNSQPDTWRTATIVRFHMANNRHNVLAWIEKWLNCALGRQPCLKNGFRI